MLPTCYPHVTHAEKSRPFHTNYGKQKKPPICRSFQHLSDFFILLFMSIRVFNGKNRIAYLREKTGVLLPTCYQLKRRFPTSEALKSIIPRSDGRRKNRPPPRQEYGRKSENGYLPKIINRSHSTSDGR